MRAVPSQIVVGKCHVHGFIKIACSTNTDVKSFNLTRITQNFQERFNMPLCTDSSNIMIIVCFSMIFTALRTVPRRFPSLSSVHENGCYSPS